MCAVSDLALIILAAPDVSFAHKGISPHRISERSRRGSFGCCRITGTGCVGAMLYRGFQSSCQSAVSNCSSMICFRRDSLYLPHMNQNYARTNDLRNLVLGRHWRKLLL